MADPLISRHCRACEGGVEPLPRSAAEALLREVPAWELTPQGTSILRTVICRDFMQAVQLIEQMAPIAEAEAHHPDFHLTGYRRLTIELSTHAIKGLSENDFILAAKLDRILPAWR